MLARSIRAEGVTTRVSTVAKARPKAMAVESWVHHWVEGAPTVIWRHLHFHIIGKGRKILIITKLFKIGIGNDPKSLVYLFHVDGLQWFSADLTAF